MRKNDFFWITIYSKYLLIMLLRFGMMLYSSLSNESLVLALSDVRADRKFLTLC